MTSDKQAAAIENPGPHTARVTAAFQGPDVNVSTTTTPRHIKFDPDYVPPARNNEPYIPRKYQGQLYELGSHKTMAEYADMYGVDTIKILPRASGSDGGYVGPYGTFLNAGDTIELPVNFCMRFVGDGSAVFVLSSENAKDEKLIAELEAKGYRFEVNRKPAAQRDEFQDVIARKKRTSTWMAGTVIPLPSNA